jgi:integrase
MMIRRRTTPDGLPFRLYERNGKRRYSIGYKGADGKWAFRMKCSVLDYERIREIRRQAIKRVANLGKDAEQKHAEGSFAALSEAWLQWQESLPDTAEEKRAESTIAENKRESAMLCKAFGLMMVKDMVKADAYDYLDACLRAVDKNGNPRPRPAKGNKEISLACTILEFGIRRRWIETNPFFEVDKLAIVRTKRYVTDQELDLAVEVGRALGGPQLIVALALKTAYLCVRRSVEVRAFTRDQIKDDGIEWEAAKRQKGQDAKHGMIEWSEELRATVNEALAIQRGKLAASWYVFGNLRGQRYTKGGWKKTLSVLMDACVKQAEDRGIPFQRFSLQECRPKAVTDKLNSGHDDVMDATLHSDERMVRAVYDRRRRRVAKPTR